MATTYTSGHVIKLIDTGGEAGTWGTSTNENFNRLEDALGGSCVINILAPGGSSSYDTATDILTWKTNNDDAAGTAGTSPVGSGRCAYVVFGDAGSDTNGTQTVVIKNTTAGSYSDKVFIAKNNLSNGRDIDFKTGGSAYTLKNGLTAIIYSSLGAKGANSDIAANTVGNALEDLQVGRLNSNSSHASNDVMIVNPTSGSFAGSAIVANTTRAANAAFLLFEGIADSTMKFKVDGTGSTYGDGSYASPAADYADMFEWEDGNPDGDDRVGITVAVASSGRIRPSSEGDIPGDVFGVVTGTACMIGNTAWNVWDRKFMKDEHGRTVHRTINGKPGPVMNPEFDESLTYVPRSHRPEWSPIGLVGRIHINKGQLTNPSWRFLREVSENTEEWLVR